MAISADLLEAREGGKHQREVARGTNGAVPRKVAAVFVASKQLRSLCSPDR